MFKLVIQDDEGKTTVVPLIRDEITIGRKEGNTIRLTERNVSRRHARILRNNGEVQIEDLGSYNGIRVNNARIAERVSLRISDQVQIGDYKLYLKAEGVEQIDQAPTMPIERVENGAPTEVMATVNVPTAPMAVPPAPPQRALGVADTDPAGRPVATAAQVAALTAPTGYGKLVVVSSNYAGKEFELTRPQMIVGRTDENDIVVNHRSISRNHAKVTRDPETQRYTISDLQSSNGVRVNGQDYGKVELRRGDVVDLGHVRLRFVEPGEDFVFDRDAVITDVTDTGGGKKGLYIALVLAVVVLGAVGAYVAFNRDPKNGSTGIVGDGSGSAIVAVNNNGSNGSNEGSKDSNEGSAMIVEAPDATTATGGSNAVLPPPDDKASEIKRRASVCLQAQADKRWDLMSRCASEQLAPLDPKGADVLIKKALAERKAEDKNDKIGDEVKVNAFIKAHKLLDQIPEESVYWKDADKLIDKAEAKLIDENKIKAAGYKRANKCSEIDVLIKQVGSQSTKAVDAVRQFKCEVVVAPLDCSSVLREPRNPACLKQFCPSHETDSRCSGNGGGGEKCDADALKNAGDTAVAQLQHTLAMSKYEDAYRCKPEGRTLQLIFMAACNIPNLTKARQYWRKLGADQQAHFLQMCQRKGIDKPQLDGP